VTPPSPTLAGPRCTLRAFHAGDAPSLAQQANDPAVAFNLFDGFPQPYTLADATLWCTTLHRQPDFGQVWAIDVGGQAIGSIGLIPGQGMRACNAEVGYWIGQVHWRQGITSAALARVTAWAWREWPPVQRIVAPIFARNAGSQAAAARAGYVLEAHLPRSLLKAGEVIDVVQWAAYRPASMAPSQPAESTAT
jgi:ribosomal-protein-alanine N-acetyltransferase